VDDEPAVREVQRRVLEAEGYLVTEAVSLLLYGTVGKPR
jgi:CheY-like chemotaxis protein